MSDYLPDDFGDLGDFVPPPPPDDFIYEGRYEFGDGSVILDVFLDPSRESFIREGELDELRDLVSLPDFFGDTALDNSYINPSDINPGETWQTGPFDSPGDALQWMEEVGVLGFSYWYEDEAHDVYVVISRDSE